MTESSQHICLFQNQTISDKYLSPMPAGKREGLLVLKPHQLLRDCLLSEETSLEGFCSNSPPTPPTPPNTHTFPDLSCRKGISILLFSMLAVGAKKVIDRKSSENSRTNGSLPSSGRTDYCPLRGWLSHPFPKQQIFQRANLILSSLLRTILLSSKCNPISYKATRSCWIWHPVTPGLSDCAPSPGLMRPGCRLFQEAFPGCPGTVRVPSSVGAWFLAYCPTIELPDSTEQRPHPRRPGSLRWVGTFWGQDSATSLSCPPVLSFYPGSKLVLAWSRAADWDWLIWGARPDP